MENYYDKERIEKIFDLSHEFFINKKLSLSEQLKDIDSEFEQQIQQILKNEVTFDIMKNRKNPWPNIVKTVNSQLPKRS